jgi:hypothetical protein
MNRNAGTSAAPAPQRPPSGRLGPIGLAPIALTLPLGFLQLWTIYIVAVIATSLLVISYRLLQRQGLNGLNALPLLFGVFNAVLYFGFHKTIVLQHLDIAIYTLLFLQAVSSLLWGEPCSVVLFRLSLDLLASNIPFVPLFFYTGERQQCVSYPF